MIERILPFFLTVKNMLPLIAAAWMIIFSVIAFALMGIDKSLARKGKWRIPEKRLFAFVILGGGPGGTLGMKLFRHKTKHWYFRLFFPLFMILQLIAYAALLLWHFGLLPR